jgi:uncharacterized membrane protein
VTGREHSLRIAIAILSLVGAGIATYLTIVDFMGETPACAAGGHGCATVANSHYSHLLGLPVSVYGFAGYIGILISAIVPGDYGRFAGFGLALVGFGFSAYLTYLELNVINAICQWCVASAITMTVLLVLCTVRVLAAPPPGTPAMDGGE